MERASASDAGAQNFGERFEARGVESGRLAPVSYERVGLHGMPLKPAAEREPRLLGRTGSGASASFESQLTSGHSFIVLFVSPDDALDEAVANDVALVELDERDAFDTLQDVDGVEEAGAAAGGRSIWVRSPVTTIFELKPWRVSTIFICSAVLFWASSRMMKLSLRVRPRMKASGATSMLARSTQFLDFVGFEHVVERVVEGAQIGIDFFLQAAGQEAEALACFDGGARENDAADALADERLDGHGDGEISFAGAGGSDAEDEIVALDGFEIAALCDRFGRENFLAEAALLAAFEERREA